MKSSSGTFHVREAQPDDAPALAALPALEPSGPSGAEADAGVRLVAEAADGALRATLTLVPRLGLNLPRPHCHVGAIVHASPELGLFRQQRTLLLGHDLTGQAELRDLAWSPGAEDAFAALIDAVSRRIAGQPDAHGERVVVELPGRRDAAGQSPFWQGFGRHFYDGDPQQAQARFGALAWRTHVAALLPRHPVYASFLPASAQAAIGRNAPGCDALRRALEQAGLRYRQHVRIDDAGPVLELDVADLCRR